MHTTTHLAAEVIRAGGPDTRLAMAALFERVLERVHRFFVRLLRAQTFHRFAYYTWGAGALFLLWLWRVAAG